MAKSDPILSPAQAAFLAKHLTGFNPATWRVELAGAGGSDRRFVRVAPPGGAAPGDSRILVLWDGGDNDWPRFLGVVDELGPAVGSLPKVYARDEQHGLILEEDFGHTTLYLHCETLRAACGDAERVYRQVIDALVEWQRLDPRGVPTIQAREMDREMFLWETEYFAEHCVTEYFAYESCLDSAWSREAERLAAAASQLPQVCIHRDFQSENILLTGDRVCFVDFQGARRGPAYYDLASLLYDPYVDLLEPDLVDRLFAYYAGVTGNDDLPSFHVCALQRLMQALGAYTNLSLHKGKDRYRAFIPRALRRLEAVARSHGGYPSILGIAIRGQTTINHSDIRN